MEESSQKLIESYASGRHRNLTLDQLAGEPPNDKPVDQAAALPRDVLKDIKEASRKTIMQIQPA